MYFDKSKLRVASELELNYDTIINDYDNFNYQYQDRLGKLKIDTLFKKTDLMESCQLHNDNG